MGQGSDATAWLASVTFADPATFETISGLATTDDGVEAAAQLLDSPTLAVRWAATVVYGGGGTDPGPLIPLLADPEPSLRLLSARALLLRGSVAGFGVAIDLLTIEDGLLGSEPPKPMWHVAARTLVAATGRSDLGPPLDADPAMRRQAQVGWHAWLAADLPGLVFDPATGEWN